jgi:hypothetical protein
VTLQYRYLAFGLDIVSALPLPELVAGGGGAEVEIRRTATLPPGSIAASETSETMTGPNEWRLTYDDVGVLTVRDGRHIEVQPLRGAPPRLVRMMVLGPAMAAVLHQRGFLLIHASVVEIDGRAAAFLGPSGAGKSTIAAVLHAAGHPLVADDVAAVRVSDGGAEVYAGFPQLKLWPDAATALGHNSRQLPRVEPGIEKRAQRLHHGFAQRKVLSLGRVYMLEYGPMIEITRLHPHAGLIALAAHGYGIQRLVEASGVEQFRKRAALVDRLGVHRLARPRSLDALDGVVASVERDMMSYE